MAELDFKEQVKNEPEKERVRGIGRRSRTEAGTRNKRRWHMCIEVRYFRAARM